MLLFGGEIQNLGGEVSPPKGPEKNTAGNYCPQTYSLSLPLEWNQVTHISTDIRTGKANKSEKSSFTVP